MKNGILVGLLLVLLTACQQPTVYVYTEALTVKQKQQLTEKLKNQTLPFKFNDLPIPKEFLAATLALSKDKLRIAEIEQLANIMQAVGYQPQINYVSVANHHYSNGNIGFYLRGEQTERHFKMPKLMRTTACSKDKYNDLQAIFSPKGLDFTLPNGTGTPLTWEYSEGYLVIYYQSTSQSYTHTTPLVSTPFGEKPSDTFAYNAQLEKPEWLNCSLQIVYMD
ncbi:hypothetical protein B0W48_09300 [Pseudoalteromonas aliena]|uniref:Lipoprotein n=1 Tax=Pseudoalteromonas aliena TaxID=247523 RepID=A0A1Q2GXU8_9GAMM|nr:hypothetical protein [Pseudoalteromonas aliena]AQP99963.1 hypothetical protein B0W48_09300 [Pseudoalteromonas aliena]